MLFFEKKIYWQLFTFGEVSVKYDLHYSAFKIIHTSKKTLSRNPF